MAHKLRLEFDGFFYHIYCRGQRKDKIFLKAKDYIIYLRILAEALLRTDAELFGYCLMPNHIHLIIRKNKQKLSKLMHMINTRYAIYFNKTYKCTGHVFQGRYKAKIILNKRYLLTLLSYIHYNPVRACLVKNLDDYSFSSHHFYKTNESHLDINKIPGFMNDKDCNLYQIFISKPQTQIPIFEDSIGTREEYLKLQKRTREIVKSPFSEKRKRNIKQDAKILFEKLNLDSNYILILKRFKSIQKQRNYVVKTLFKMGYTESEIAKYFKYSRSGINRILKK